MRFAVLPACLLLACLVAPAPALRAQTFTNPVVGGGADPWAVQWKGQYFYTRTTGSDVRVSRSPWLQSLNSNSRTVWNPPTNTPYGNNIWAPELHRLNDKWYLYVAADDGADANHRMFVLEGDSSDPQGSYTLKGQISIPSNRWAIDGTVMEHGGTNYFVWSGRTSGTTVDIGSSQSLYIAEMSNPWTLTGTRTRISSPTYTWERHGHSVNEGPQVLRNPGGEVFLTYSASGFYTPEYAIGALKLTGSNPLLAASWTKLAQPLFDQGNGVEGTGHASFVKSPDETQDWIVYHARTAPDAPRDVRIQPFTFGADGVPQFGEPIPTGQVTAAPSGVPRVTFVPNQSFERGGTGWLDDFRAFGDAGAADNDGTTFSHIAGGDGPRVGYLTVGAAGGDSGIYQDVGPAHAGMYTLSVGLALGDDTAAAAALNPATFLLRLERVGLHPGGSANEADKSILGEFAIESSELLMANFRYFELSAAVPVPDIDTWLRVGVYSPTALTASGTPWSVKLDGMSLDWSGEAASDVPEPGAAAVILCGSLLLAGRRQRRRKAAIELTQVPLPTAFDGTEGRMVTGLRETGPRRAKRRLFLAFDRATSAWRNAHAKGTPSPVGFGRGCATHLLWRGAVMNLSKRMRVLSAAAVAAAFLVSAGPAVEAAPSEYETAVQAQNPFAYFRQQETGIVTSTTADDVSTNNRDATYQGSPTGGITGAGTGSDNAVTYSGTPVGTATQYFGGSALRPFGSSLATSSLEFLFRTNPSLPTQKQSLFGVFNAGATMAAEVTLNSQGNDALADTPNTTRFFVRGDDGDAVGVHFTNPTLYDGGFHHLVYTFDRSTLSVTPDPDGAGPLTATFTGGFAAYVDGVAQALTIQVVGTGATDAGVEPDTFSDFAFDPTFSARNVRTTLGGAAIGRQANITLDEAALYASVLTPEQVAAHAVAAGIPEPTSLAMLALGGLGLLRRRRTSR